MKHKDYRTEIKALSTEMLKHRRNSLLDSLLRVGGDTVGKLRTANMLSYTEVLLEKRLREEAHKQRLNEMKEELNALTIIK